MATDGLFLHARFLARSTLDSLVAPAIAADAYEYDHERETVHVAVVFAAPSGAWTLRLSLYRDVDHGPVAELDLEPAAGDVPKAEYVINASRLAPGSYCIRALLLDSASQPLDRAQWDFVRHPSTAAPRRECCPIDIPLVVEPFPDSVDASWAISTSVPLARGLARDVRQLVLLEDGQPIAAQFNTRSHWGALASICWVSVDFLARYRRGVPARYSIRVSDKPSAQPAAGNVGSEDAPTIELRTAGGTFEIDRKAFAGPVYKANARSAARPAYDGGGPYLVDEHHNVYEARHVRPESVELIENGPVKATVAVRGWYGSDPRKGPQKKLGRYVTHICAFAHSPLLRISHRTIVTFDPDITKLADVGWRVPSPVTGTARFALDGSVRHVTVGVQDAAYVHQDRHDRCWLLTAHGHHLQRAGPMRRADGIVSLEGHRGEPDMHFAVLLRDAYQKFPKELGVSWTAQGAELSLHFWPRHGHRAFNLASTPPDPQFDELHRNNIYKLWYAHEGALLDLKMPAAYVNWLQSFTPAPTDENPIGDNAITNARDGKAIGVAIGNEFAIACGHAGGDAELVALARAFQIDPHAIASPEWSSTTGVEGPWAPRDAVSYPRIERAIHNGILAMQNGIVDIGGEYGMWIYADVHDKWLPHLGDPPAWGVPQLHRVWQASHYRNVWANWLLYLRSGIQAFRLWARATSDHYLHVDTVHHVDPVVRGGKHLGDLYHCYATTPWGAESDVYGHYVDPDAHRMRGLIHRDDYALDMYRAWFASLIGFYPGSFGSGREAINTFGAVVSYYMFAQDPDALLLLHRMIAGIFEGYLYPGAQQFDFSASPNPADHPVWHRQCYMNYYELTRDARAVRLVTDWLDAGYGGHNALSLHAFAYAGTGNVDYVERARADVLDQSLLYHDAPGDRYHGYGPAVAVNDDSYFFQEAPYFLRALANAGLAETTATAPPSCYPSVHWSAFYSYLVAVRVYVAVPGSAAQFGIRLAALRHRNAVERGQCDVFRWSSGSGAWTPVRTVPYAQNPGTVDITIPNGNIDSLYRIDIATTESEFVAPFTDYPEVLEVRQMFFNGSEWLYAAHGWARQSFWMDWTDDPAYPAADLGLGAQGTGGYYHQPSFVSVAADGQNVAWGKTVFAWAQDPQRAPLPAFREMRQTLTGPRPLHMFTSSVAGPVLRLWSGPPRVFLALERAHLAQVVPLIP